MGTLCLVLAVCTSLIGGCKAKPKEKIDRYDLFRNLNKFEGSVSIFKWSRGGWEITFNLDDYSFQGKGETLGLAYEDAIRKKQKLCEKLVLP